MLLQVAVKTCTRVCKTSADYTICFIRPAGSLLPGSELRALLFHASCIGFLSSPTVRRGFPFGLAVRFVAGNLAPQKLAAGEGPAGVGGTEEVQESAGRVGGPTRRS